MTDLDISTKLYIFIVRPEEQTNSFHLLAKVTGRFFYE